MCINCDGHHSGGSSFVYVQMIFVITEIVCAPIGTGTALRKNRSMRVPIYSIDSIAPRIWFGLANRVGPGSGGRDTQKPAKLPTTNSKWTQWH